MSKVTIIYWSGTGNTEVMAEAIASGVNEAGSTAEVVSVENASKDMVVKAKTIAFGCPSMGAEVLEEELMEPFIESLSDIDFSDKSVALFGSYDWGDGEWMRNWEEQMQGFGAKLIGSGLIIRLSPDASGVEQCKSLGSQLVKFNE